MGTSSKIQWTDATWNPWHGCKKVSPGCKFCYMYREKDRYAQDPSIVLRSKTRFRAPIGWKTPKKVFTCSWSDFFVPEADTWRAEAWEIIRSTPHLTYQILTKRPERIKDCLPPDWGTGYPNVWLGVSVETALIAENRLQLLLSVPCGVRFASAEPLLENILTDRTRALMSKIDWLIIGGESGNASGDWLYRETEQEWITDLVLYCKSVELPCFVKQLGSHLAKLHQLKDRFGGDPAEWEEILRVREFPHPVLLDS